MNDTNTSSPSEIELRIDGMDCADCALTLERGISQLDGVEFVQVNFVAGTLQARGRVTADAITERVHALGYDVASDEKSAESVRGRQANRGGVAGFARYLLADRRTQAAVAAGVFLVVAALAGWLLPPPVGKWVATALELTAITLAGFPIARKGLRMLWHSRQITIDLLMTIATLGALIIGEMGEAATVILLFAVGEALEGYTAERARDSLRSLLTLAPEQAVMLRPCIDCAEHIGVGGYEGGPCPFCGTHETKVPVEQVAVGERVIVRPGERIPVDGVVVAGASAVNQAPITGESMPVARAPGDDVFAGTINGEAALEIEVARPASDSMLRRIVRLVEQAQGQRSPAERFIDHFARWYTPAVVVVALLVATIPPLVFGQPFLDAGDPMRGWLYRALALLIIACPCALVISTPVTVVSALASLARRGVLVKGGVFLDVLACIKVFAFDKTGTLTEGEPAVVQTRTPFCQTRQDDCAACDDLLALAAAVERRSEHPLARAVVAEAEARLLGHRYPPAEAVQALAGRGVQGRMNGSTVTVGSHDLMHEIDQDCAALHDEIEAAEANGQTVLLVGRDGKLEGFIGVADQPRKGSRDMLQALKAQSAGVRNVMLTGDNPAVARSIASRVSEIDEVRAGLLPEAKVEAVRSLLADYGPVAMVGDGVNDAPALALASVGIAMGGAGTAQAMETADVVLMQDDLRRLPDLIHTSRRAHRIIRQNIAFSLLIKAVFLALALPGLATMWMAVFADMGASLLVTLNGMRLLRGSEAQ